jgi:hypothetical protein
VKIRKRQSEKNTMQLEPMLNFNRTGTMFMKNHFETENNVDKFVYEKEKENIDEE